jgi:hypothetical protein
MESDLSSKQILLKLLLPFMNQKYIETNLLNENDFKGAEVALKLRNDLPRNIY